MPKIHIEKDGWVLCGRNKQECKVLSYDSIHNLNAYNISGLCKQCLIVWEQSQNSKEEKDEKDSR